MIKFASDLSPLPRVLFNYFSARAHVGSLINHNIQSICLGSLSNSQGDSMKFVYILNMVKGTSNNSLYRY